jgi:tellurite resistance protein TerC
MESASAHPSGGGSGRTDGEMDTPLHWIAFNVLVLIAIALDLGVFHRKAHKISVREALAWSLVWIGLACGFGLSVLYFYGRRPGLEFFTGYVIEKALSVDNLFVFLVVFRVFAVKEEYQQRVLGYGILGALLMRGAMIAAGAALIARFEWIMYVFGAFIVYAGLHMLIAKDAESHPEKNFVVRYLSKHLRLTKDYRGAKFFTRENGALFATPLFLVLLVVEITDVTFAIDSIPAIFGITRDTFIVYSSNVFAILGLRALYFLLAGVLDKFAYLKVGLALVLIFVGAKMIVEPWLHISVGVSLAVVLGMLLIAVLVSLLVKKNTPN